MVLLYVKNDSVHCSAVRDALQRRGVDVCELNVEEHPELIPELIKLTGGRRIVPVLVEAGRVEVAPNGGDEF